MKMSELKSSEYFIDLCVKVTLVRFAEPELIKLMEEQDYEKIDLFLKNLGTILIS